MNSYTLRPGCCLGASGRSTKLVDAEPSSGNALRKFGLSGCQRPVALLGGVAVSLGHEGGGPAEAAHNLAVGRAELGDYGGAGVPQRVDAEVGPSARFRGSFASVLRELTPVWTMPGNEANTGHLTSGFRRIVGAARQSVTAATYSFQDTSQMWTALKAASERPGVVVTVYVDAAVADAATVKAQLPRATVYRSAVPPNGRQVVSHAKFIVVDRELLLITSANVSYSAEDRNVEFGILVRHTALARSVEATMTSTHGSLYELV